MRSYRIPGTDLTVSRIAYGCMNLGGTWDRARLTSAQQQAAIEAIRAAYDVGINLFDHADIYAYGKSETAFAAIWDQIPREKIILQSKCGIILADDPRYGGPGRYDLSYEHILSAVTGSLERLQTDYLDILLLHRPDPLMRPETVARAFSELHAAGKVRYFGVSNHTPAQIALLQRAIAQPLLIDQLQLSLFHHHLISAGITANRLDATCAHAADALDYFRQHDMLVQAWSPLAGGRLFRTGPDAGAAEGETAALLARLAEARGVSPSAIALAWLLRHPAGIQPLIGTTNPAHIRASARADEVTLTRKDWYALLAAARGAAVP